MRRSLQVFLRSRFCVRRFVRRRRNRNAQRRIARHGFRHGGGCRRLAFGGRLGRRFRWPGCCRRFGCVRCFGGFRGFDCRSRLCSFRRLRSSFDLPGRFRHFGRFRSFSLDRCSCRRFHVQGQFGLRFRLRNFHGHFRSGLGFGWCFRFGLRFHDRHFDRPQILQRARKEVELAADRQPHGARRIGNRRDGRGRQPRANGRRPGSACLRSARPKTVRRRTPPRAAPPAALQAARAPRAYRPRSPARRGVRTSAPSPARTHQGRGSIRGGLSGVACARYRSFSVERPTRHSSIVMIQKRTTTCVSRQPLFSKWWCSGAILSTRRPSP